MSWQRQIANVTEERDHLAQVARDTFEELKSVTAERDAALQRIGELEMALEVAKGLVNEPSNTEPAADISGKLVFRVAKAIWDKREAEYWDHEEDCRPFVLGQLLDDEPQADAWLGEVREILITADELTHEPL